MGTVLVRGFEVEGTLVVVCEAELLTVVAEPPGIVVGTVEGCRTVFQVAVVGQAVVATTGDAVSYGVGPGTDPVQLRLQSNTGARILTSVCIELSIYVDQNSL